MYNFFRVRNLKLYNTCALTKQTITTPFRRPCTFCSHITYTNYPVRAVGSQPGKLGSDGLKCHSSSYCSTNLIMNELKKRKRYSKQRKRFAELLEVIRGGHSETVARVKNLRAKEVSLLAENPDITLEHVYNLRKNSGKKKLNSPVVNISSPVVSFDKSVSSKLQNGQKIGEKLCTEDRKTSRIVGFNNELDRHNVIGGGNSHETLSVEEIEDIHDEIHDVDSIEKASLLNDPIIKQDVLNEIKKTESIEPDVKKPVKAAKRKRVRTSLSNDKEQMGKVKDEELKSAAKQQSLNAILLAYLETCVSCGFLNRSLAMLQYYVKRTKHNTKLLYPDDIRIFDVLLQGFAEKGKYEKFLEVWNIMKTLKLVPSCNSYAAWLECVYQAAPSVDNVDRSVIDEILKEMSSKGISVNDLFEKCTFIDGQREVLMQVMRYLNPTFEPQIASPNLCYSCSLLQQINQESSTLVSPAEGLLTVDQLKVLGRKQFEDEIQGTVPIKSIEKRLNSSPFVGMYREKLDNLKKMWEKEILKALNRDINTMNAALNHTKSFIRHSTLFPFLKVLTPEQYKDIIMQEICKLAEGSESFSPTTLQLYRDLGLKVRSRFIVKYKQDHGVLDKIRHLYDDYCEWYIDPRNKGFRSTNSRREWQQLVHLNQKGPTIDIDEKVWPPIVLFGVGKFLYNIIMYDIKIDVNILRLKNYDKQFLPAFYMIFRQQSNKSVEEIKPHPVLSKLFRATEPEDLLFDVNLVPMACPPLPWTSPDSGGYLIVKSDFLRLPTQAFQQKDRLESVPSTQLYPTYDSLNQLSCVPWKVNTKVLDTMVEVFNSGGSSKLDVPEPPSSCPIPDPSVYSEMTNVERYQAFQKRLAIRRKKAEMYSLWCDALYRLSLANHFRDGVFWLPHNMDFRGRVYPCPPHLNHLGSDLARSLLLFAKGKPLGETGLDWLKIHVVNLTGLKKKNSVIDRLVYANEIIDDIIDSAERPLTGRMWWSESENPWQTLACCIEIWNAIQHPGGPASFVSYYPVHQDGSCNGLQHYAALGRDRDGAISVNLSPAPVPQDVYSRVAAMVENERSKDAANGVKVAQQLDGIIQRKVIKQTVMTTVYGVTRFGARLQIAKQLKDIEAFPKDLVWSASTYLVGKTFESLRQMFTSTREIQDWFTECARLISQTCGQNVEYITPLGLPVVQPYIRRNVVKAPSLSNGRIETTNSALVLDMFERPNVMKQKNAFPPNFIHSLDSSHMMLTSLHCEQEGITFVSVHDCFWTHPASVHIMNRICREQFVALHSQPILQNLSSFLIERFGYSERELEGDENQLTQAKQRLNNVLRNLPPTGTFELKSVMESTYFFS